MPKKGGKVPASKPLATSSGGAGGVPVFFGVGTRAVAVFEIDSEIFDRFAREFFTHALVNRRGKILLNAENFGKSIRVRRVSFKRANGERAEPDGGI